MDVLGTGFGRTGTLSTKLALERLGFGPCHHMTEAMRRPAQFRALEAHTRGQAVDWREVFAGYRSQVDFPGAATIWRDLLAAFPEAKVVHTVRDADRWYDSTYATIFPARSLVAPWVRRLVPPVDRIFTVNDALIWDGLFDGRFEDRDHAIAVYEQRTRDVIDTVPPDRLLVYDVADGWPPLCAFLGAPIPDEPFPRANDRRSMRRRLALIGALTHGARWVAVPAALVLLARVCR